MRYTFFLVFLLVAGCTTTREPIAPPVPAMVDVQGPGMVDYRVDELDFPAVRGVALPEIERVELPNGLVVFLTEDRSLPLVRASARIGMGSLWEPADKVGLAGITAGVMRSGGAGTLSSDALNEALENMGASVEVRASGDATFASMTTLAEHVDTVLPLFAAVLMEPQFEEEKIELAKTQAKSAIARRNDNPQGIATRELFKKVYGPDSPYARTTEYWTIDAVERDDVVAFHDAYVHPGNTFIALWGDFDAEAMGDKIRATFEDWEAEPGFKRPEPPAVDAPQGRAIYTIEKDDVTQSTVLIGHVGEVTLEHPDYFPLIVMNEILGGGFSSRLFQRVRSDLGLAYAVFGNYSADYETPGTFYSGTFTKSPTTVKAAQAMLAVIEGMKEQTPTDEEMRLAKDAFLNSFVFNFDTKAEVLNRQMTYAYYGYPDDFIQQIKAGVERVEAEDVQRVARQYLHPDGAKILVLGNSDDFDEPVRSLGDAEPIDITIPLAPPSESAAATIAWVDPEVLDRVLRALGGREAFAAIETLRYSGSTEAPMQGQTVTLQTDVAIALPDRVRVMQQTPMGEITIALNGSDGTIDTPAGSQPAPPALVDQVRAQLFQDLPYLFARAEELKVISLELQEDMPKVFELKAPGLTSPIKLWVDLATSRPLQLEMTVVGMQGPQQIVVEYSNYRDVDGLVIPFASSQTVDGEPGARSNYTTIEINPELDSSLFEIEE